MADMKPVGVIELFHVDASCYGKNGAEIADANMFVDLPVGTELYSAAQLEQARREEREACATLIKRVRSGLGEVSMRASIIYDTCEQIEKAILSRNEK